MKRKQAAIIILLLMFLMNGFALAACNAPSASYDTASRTLSWTQEGSEPRCYIITACRNGSQIWTRSYNGRLNSCVLPGNLTGEIKICINAFNGCDDSASTWLTVNCGNTDSKPTAEPTPVPTAEPTPVPTAKPTPVPTAKPTPVPTVKPTNVPTAQPDLYNDMAAQVVSMVNAERAKHGLSALKTDANLSAAACIRAQEIAVKFSHTRPDGSSCFTVSNKAGGENIANGYTSAASVMEGWMNSEGHRANILNSSFRTIGVCCAKVNGKYQWVQLFGR